MAELGLITILLALALAIYSMLASIIGGMRNLPALSQSGRNACYLVALILLISSFSLVAAFLSNNFQIRYVFEHSSLAMPRIYTWVAIYAGNEGSLLFISTVFAVLAALAVAFAPRRFRPSLPYANAVLMLIMVFFVSVMASLANPFVTLDFMPADGRGINPLLVHPGMFAHPPILMTGLVMVSIPFAFAVGALLSKQVVDEWVDVARVWGLLAWVTLGTGLLLGSWWAYTILGWGGYWAWDPVENAGLMPWLGLTAFIHSIMVQKRQGMFRMWNLALINITFGLSLFGMFINRGGPVPSVHSFAASSLGWVFLTFMIVGTLAPFLLFFIRYNLIKSARPLESSLSREAAFLVNNLLLLGVAFVTLWGVVYPLVSEVFSGFTVTVGEPFYNQVNGHIFLGLMFLMGVGPLLPWRRAGGRAFKRTLLYPAIAAAATLAVLALVGVRNPYALAAFTLFALVAAGIFQEWYRGTRVRHTRGESIPSGLPQTHGLQPPPIWRLRGASGRCSPGRRHRRFLLLRHPAGRAFVAGTDRHRGGLRHHLPRFPHRPADGPARIFLYPRRVTRGQVRGRAGSGAHLLPRLQHQRHPRRYSLNPRGRPLRGPQRGARRRPQHRVPHIRQPTGVVDVAGWPHNDRRDRRGPLALPQLCPTANAPCPFFRPSLEGPTLMNPLHILPAHNSMISLRRQSKCTT